MSEGLYVIFAIVFVVGILTMQAMFKPLVLIAGLSGALIVRRHPIMAAVLASGFAYIAIRGPHGYSYADMESGHQTMSVFLFGISGGLIGLLIGGFVALLRSFGQLVDTPEPRAEKGAEAEV